MTAQANVAPVVRNADQHRILVAYARGENISAIAETLSFHVDYVSDIVSQMVGFDRGRARQLAADYDRQRSAVAAAKPAAKKTPPAVRPVVQAASAEPEEEPEEPEGPAPTVDPAPVPLVDADQLLARAQASSVAKVRTLAGKVRGQLAELATLLEHSEAEEQARARVANLEAELQAARTALRAARGVTTPTTAPARTTGNTDGPPAAVVRAWCRETGVECSPTGRVNQSAVDAYLRANGEAA